MTSPNVKLNKVSLTCDGVGVVYQSLRFFSGLYGFSDCVVSLRAFAQRVFFLTELLIYGAFVWQSSYGASVRFQTKSF